MRQHVYRKHYMRVLAARGVLVWDQIWADHRLCEQLRRLGLYAMNSDGLCVRIGKAGA